MLCVRSAQCPSRNCRPGPGRIPLPCRQQPLAFYAIRVWAPVAPPASPTHITFRNVQVGGPPKLPVTETETAQAPPFAAQGLELSPSTTPLGHSSPPQQAQTGPLEGPEISWSWPPVVCATEQSPCLSSRVSDLPPVIPGIIPAFPTPHLRQRHRQMWKSLAFINFITGKFHMKVKGE